jgi:hypothetical protein
VRAPATSPASPAPTAISTSIQSLLCGSAAIHEGFPGTLAWRRRGCDEPTKRRTRSTAGRKQTAAIELAVRAKKESLVPETSQDLEAVASA